MRYYRIALLAHPTYGPGDPVWSCYESLVQAGHAVEIIDPDRFPGVLRSDGTPDDAVLSAFRARFRPDYFSVGNESAEEILGKLNGIAEGRDLPARHFVVFGYVGCDNFGDELIFSTICDQLAERFPGSYVSLIGHNPQASLRRQGVVSVLNEMKFEADVLLNGASALIFMAGIMFDQPFEDWSAGPVDPWLNPRSEIGGQTAFVLMAAARGVPSVFLGIGAGPLANPDAQRLIRLQARNGALYLPRDETTERLLIDAGVPATSVRRKADLAFLCNEEAARGAAAEHLAGLGLKPGGYVVVALRDHESVGEAFVPHVAAALDRLWETSGLRPLFVDFAPEDAAIHGRIRRLMRHMDETRVFGLAYGFAEVIDVLASARLVFAMRLHCSIVANACCVPSIGLDYNDKVGAFYQLMDRSRALLPMDATDEAMASCFSRMLSVDESVQIAGRAEELRTRASEAFDELGEAIDSSKSIYAPRLWYSRRVSLEEQSLHEREVEVEGLRHEAEELRNRLSGTEREVEKLRSSHSFKVGHALMYVPGMVKRLLRR